MSLKTLSLSIMYPTVSRIFDEYLSFLDDKEKFIIEFVQETKKFKSPKYIKPFILDHCRDITIDADTIFLFTEKVANEMYKAVYTDSILKRVE